MRFGLNSLLILILSGLAVAQTQSSKTQSSGADIETFITSAEARLNDLTVKGNRAGWVQETYITDDTEAISAAATENLLAAISELAAQAKQFEAKPMTAEQARKLKLRSCSPRHLLPAIRPSERNWHSWAAGSMEPTAKANIVPRQVRLPENASARTKWSVPLPPPRMPKCCSTCGPVGIPSRHLCGRSTSVSWNSRTRALAKWVLPMWERCGARITI